MAGGEYPPAGRFQPSAELRRQQPVEETAAAQGDLSNAGFAARPAQPFAQGQRERGVKNGRARAGFCAIGQPRQQRQQIQHAVVTQMETVGQRRRRPVSMRQRFQLHRRLSLVIADLAHAEQGGGGVEQAAGAAGLGC